MLLLDDTLEASPTGELALDGELPAIEEIPTAAADLDETFLAEMAEQPTLPPSEDWANESMLDGELPAIEEIPTAAADLDETFLAEMAEQPTLPPSEDWADELMLDESLPSGGSTELSGFGEESLGLSDFELSDLDLPNAAVDPANPMEGSIAANELLLDLSDESADSSGLGDLGASSAIADDLF